MHHNLKVGWFQVKEMNPELKPNEILSKLAEMWKAESVVTKCLVSFGHLLLPSHTLNI